MLAFEYTPLGGSLHHEAPMLHLGAPEGRNQCKEETYEDAER